MRLVDDFCSASRFSLHFPAQYPLCMIDLDTIALSIQIRKCEDEKVGEGQTKASGQLCLAGLSCWCVSNVEVRELSD